MPKNQNLGAMLENAAVNVDEVRASAVYGPSVDWFRRARWKGDGPTYIKLAGRVLYPVKELEAYFAARLVRSTSEYHTHQQPTSGRPRKHPQAA